MGKTYCYLYECLVTETAFDKFVLSNAAVVVGIQGVKDLSDRKISQQFIPRSFKAWRISWGKPFNQRAIWLKRQYIPRLPASFYGVKLLAITLH